MKKIFYKIKNSEYEELLDDNGYPYFWDDVTFSCFTKRINAGNSDCQLILARSFDDYGENEDVSLGNIVEITKTKYASKQYTVKSVSHRISEKERTTTLELEEYIKE